MLDYISCLRTVQDKVADKIVIIPRIYTGKLRTTGDGYKGLLHQPDSNATPDLLKGVIAMRSQSSSAYGVIIEACGGKAPRVPIGV